jgi:hypothetical protein
MSLFEHFSLYTHLDTPKRFVIFYMDEVVMMGLFSIVAVGVF